MNLGNLTEDQRRQLNELLSASSIGSMGGQGYLNGQQNGRLSDLMNPQPQPQMMPDGMPENYIQRGNNPPIPIQPSPRSMGPALDYSSAPVDFGGMKGYRVKGDPMSIVMADGRIVRMGADTGADRKRMGEDLQMQMNRQKLAEGDVDLQTKRMQLAELTGMDTAQMGGLNQMALQRRYGKAPAGWRRTANGELEIEPGGPADEKARQKELGATDVDQAVGTLRDAYNRLEEGGGITSTKNSGLSNLPAAIASSGPGQAMGKMFGTDNQSARNDIAMTRPALLAALMKATGMSAKQMDSNAELKLWMATATDPTLDVESNRRALANIEKKYIGARAQAPKGGEGKHVTVTNDAEYNALPKGAIYITPTGETRTKR